VEAKAYYLMGWIARGAAFTDFREFFADPVPKMLCIAGRSRLTTVALLKPAGFKFQQKTL